MSKIGRLHTKSSALLNAAAVTVQVWIWSTALSYLIVRTTWRWEMHTAAKQQQKEQELEEQQLQEWQRFADKFSQPPQPRPGNTTSRGWC